MSTDLGIKKKKNRYDGIIIKYANELARKHTQFTLEEQKAIHLIFSHIKPFQKNPTTFQINKIDFFEKLSLTGDDKYKRYEKITDNLIIKSFARIESKNETNKGIIIYNVKWNKGKEYFEVDLNPNFMPYLQNIIDHYTNISLDNLIRFKSNHTLNLYKFICSWNDKKETEITTKELKEMFNLSKEAYVQNEKFNRAAFERDTIKKAINEINKVTELLISFKKNKKGNKVLNYHFKWINKLLIFISIIAIIFFLEI